MRGVLNKFEQYAAGSLWMDESDKTVVRAASRFFVNESRAGLFEARQSETYVGHLHGDVMNTCATLLQKLRDWRIFARGLQQFDARLANRQHRDSHTLLRNLFRCDHVQTERVAPKFKSLFDAFSRDSDVLNLHKKVNSK